MRHCRVVPTRHCRIVNVAKNTLLLALNQATENTNLGNHFQWQCASRDRFLEMKFGDNLKHKKHCRKNGIVFELSSAGAKARSLSGKMCQCCKEHQFHLSRWASF